MIITSSQIKNIKKEAEREIEEAQDILSLDNLWKKYLGRKEGKMNAILRGIKDLPSDQRPQIGALANQVSRKLQDKINQAKEKIRQGENKSSVKRDFTLPGRKIDLGHEHPLTQMRWKIAEIFISLGFEILDGPEMETEYYNFEALNIPDGHPARDMWDTFFLKDLSREKLKNVGSEGKLLLRTHTSPMQIRFMEKHQPPLRAGVIGRCFRNEATDVSHEHTLYQVEGFCVDEDINVSNLIYTLRSFLSLLFGQEVKIRLRPSYFPFTEPSFEVDFSCLNCGGKGCSVCGQSGWVEMLGCGMIHPRVYEAVGYPAGKYQGFAFGIGLDRLVMMLRQVDDIRWFHSGDLRFIRQF
jgi:phenylalanyl-tRNA synthetase alpha chain